MVIDSFTEKDTFEAGKKIGERAQPGDVYVLTGDLGAGKTMLSQGVAAGLGIQDCVSSPTFTIVQIYEDGRLPFYHFDVYRIGDIEEMEEIGYQEYFYSDGVTLIEWGELVEEILPEAYYKITIEKNPERGFEYRRILLEGSGLPTGEGR
ncbi:MAG: tRNA (adenosine(37)-N6)-threonylcarbamoyltransferase complex ATPase subunit type 1 TsaE [Lachnospiraceae bacterium]|nr:tRNA (adenosine(37)-N6)-threonylcarbamoyltransferase complex ATPase subunit type 1 TsaE [Lachnospiraceae bacterium]